MPHFDAVQSWSPLNVAKWISGLHPLAQHHSDLLLEHNTNGSTLLGLNWNDLKAMEITGMYEQEALLSAISILREVDEANKSFLLYPIADRIATYSKEAVEHIVHLKIMPGDIERKRELYLNCINCSNLSRTILIYMDKYHIVFEDRRKLAHDLLCSLYSIAQATNQLKHSLRAVGVHVPDIPQELPFTSRNNCFPTCLHASLSSLCDNTRYMVEHTVLGRRGCPTFERITLHPDGDTGWGFSFRETSSGLYIVKRILPNTPADKCGRIKSGDEVIEVNDQNIVGWKIKNVVELIRSHPFGLVMVVRHYHTGEEEEIDSSPDIPATRGARVTTSAPAASGGHLTPTRTRVQQLSGANSEPGTTDTPKKPPRPKDSVLRERCKSSNELDQHFKTVHNPKRLSQIYGDPNLHLGFEDMIDTTTPVRVDRQGSMDGYLTCPNRRKRTHPAPPAHHKRNSSNPLDKYNILSNREWFDSVVKREDHVQNMNMTCIYGTGPRVKAAKSRRPINVSMPDISPESIDKHPSFTQSYDAHMDLTPQHRHLISSLSNSVTSRGNSVTSRGTSVTSRSNSVTSPRNSMTSDKPDVVKNIALYCEQYLNENCNDGLSDEENNVSEYSTTQSLTSNANSEITNNSSLSTKTMPSSTRSKSHNNNNNNNNNNNSEESKGEFKNFPVSKESICTTVIIGGVVHKIPVDIANKHSNDNNPNKNNTATKNRKRQNKRASWSIASDIKSATLPKNIRFSLADLDENGTLKKKKNKKPSRSSSAILGDTNVSCKSLYPNACEGWLMKLGGSGLTPRNWRRRWFVLKGFCLYYFKTPQDTTALGVITLPSFNIATASEIKKKNAFKAYHKNTRTYYFIADNPEEKQRWMDKLLLASILYDENESGANSPPPCFPPAASPPALVSTQVCSLKVEQACKTVQQPASTTVV